MTGEHVVEKDVARLAVVRDLLVSVALAEAVVEAVLAALPEYRTRAVTNTLVRLANDAVIDAERVAPTG